jgi:tungstate transport system permease protein
LIELLDGIARAMRLIAALDPDVMEITGKSLAFSSTSCLIATLITVPAGSLIHFRDFPGKRYIVSLIQTLYSLPTVAIGLFVFVLLSRSGPMGSLGLLFTPAAIVTGQVILITPVMLGLVLTAFRGIDPMVTETAVSLGADRLQRLILSIREARFGITTAVIMGFGRVISEVGISLMVGGNIKGFTRTLTTAISLETSKGDLELSFALGILLMIIALLVNIVLNRLQGR